MRVVLHLDMDAFFAAVEERDGRGLRGLPIVVGADPKNGKGRGVVSTANYRARSYGIHSAQPISQAWRLAEEARKRGEPEVVFIPPDFPRYEESSRNIRMILLGHSSVIEQGSIDEFYLELQMQNAKIKDQNDIWENAKKIASEIKQAIKDRERLTCSIGVGPNKMIAKIASGMNKPDGLTVVSPEELQAFLDPLPIRAIPGIGPRAGQELGRLGIRIIKDAAALSRGKLEEVFGKRGSEIYQKVRGVDDSPVAERESLQSIGEQETFPEDIRDSALLLERIGDISDRVFERFRASGFTAFRTVAVRVRFSDFETHDRARTVGEPQSARDALRFEALRLLAPFLDRRENPKEKAIRLVGVRIEKFS